MSFEVVGDITDIETIAVNLSIRERAALRKKYGGQRWRKMKGRAQIRLLNGDLRKAEIHWYEAHGVGRRKWKIKHLLD